VNQGNSAGAIGVILNRMDLARDPVLVPPKVNQAVMTHVPTTTMANRDLALVIASARLLLPRPQALWSISTRSEISKIGHTR